MIRSEPIGDIQKAGHVARAYTLHDVSLVEFSARRSAPYSKEAMPRMQLHTSHEAAAELASDGQVLAVRVEFVVSALAPDASPGEPRVRVSGAFALDYEKTVKDAKFDQASFDVFARINGIYNAWPYMREVVSNAFSRLGYPRLTLESLVINPASPTKATKPAKPASA